MADTLIKRVEACKDVDNRLDVLIEVALFEPDETYRAARANNAGTKIIITRHDGAQETYWAWDWTMNAQNRRKAIDALRAREAAHG